MTNLTLKITKRLTKEQCDFKRNYSTLDALYPYQYPHSIQKRSTPNFNSTRQKKKKHMT